jgi:hypothetical protein
MYLPKGLRYLCAIGMLTEPEPNQRLKKSPSISGEGLLKNYIQELSNPPEARGS